jgi:conjugal transfer/entry exclusion protein
MIDYVFAFYALVACNLVVFLGALYAHARVRAIDKTLAALDWETLANLTGEVGAIKRSLQKTNNRINGMHSSDPIAVLQNLPQLQTVTNGTMPKGG